MTDVETGARSRTRQAILSAALRTLAAEPAASLGDVAEAAGVGRTTLHRYFPERSDLVVGLTQECVRRLEDAQARARPDDGTGREALLRLTREYFDLGDDMALVFHGVVVLDDEWSTSEEDRDLSLRVVARGRDDGSIDPDQPPGWIVNLLWCALYAGWSWTQETGASRHDALALVLRSLDGAVRPRD